MPYPRPTAALILFAALLAHTGAHAEKPRKPTPPQPAQTYPMHDTHPSEQVTIAAEPCDTKALTPDFRLDYLGHGMMPIRVIVTNDSGQPLTLDDARIHLISANNDNLPAATLDDLQRRLFSLKSATGHKVPLPLPIPVPVTTGKQNVDKKILDDDHDFSFQTTTVPPHSTVAGYLFYDIQGLTDNPSTSALTHATLELRKVRFAARPNTSAEYLDSFEIPLAPTKP